jgi:hypothetical protein
MKCCTRCGKYKNFSDFYNRGPKSHQSRCKECSKEIRIRHEERKAAMMLDPAIKKCRRCKEEKLIGEFYRMGAYYQANCKPCNTIVCVENYHKRKQRRLESKKYREPTYQELYELPQGIYL